MEAKSLNFKRNAAEALQDQDLQNALKFAKDGFIGKRTSAVAQLPEWNNIRDDVRVMKNHVLDNLDHYLLAYEAAVVENGGEVHWAQTPEEATDIIATICSKGPASHP